MGNYEQLKQSVSDVIKTNGNQEITGSILQNVLLTIISSVGANATFAGIATPTTNPGTPDGPVFWLASEGGTYSNFNAIELQDGLSVLMWNGSWNSQQIFGVDDEPTAGSDNLVKSGGIYAKIKAIEDAGYIFAGIATPTTNPDMPDQNVFYIASEAGAYTNFGGAELQDGLSLLMWNGSWSNQQIFSVDNEPTAGSDNLVKSGGVQEELALGAVYDVSAKNPTGGSNNDGKWESLSALLSDANLNTLVPTAVRKGGMNIKFVQSSDNKYVQYRLMSDSFNTTVANWQGVDEEPVVGSKNLVESGGVEKLVGTIITKEGHFALVDENGYIGAVFTDKGLNINDVLLNGKSIKDIFGNIYNQNDLFYITDGNGYIAFGVKKNGDIIGGEGGGSAPQTTYTATLELPKKVNVMQGGIYNLYFEQMLGYGFTRDYMVTDISLPYRPELDSMKVWGNVTNSVGSTTKSIKLYNTFGAELEQKSFSLNVVSKSKSGSLKICVCGDSMTDNPKKLLELANLCAKDGNLSLTFLGVKSYTGTDSDGNTRTVKSCSVSGSNVVDLCRSAGSEPYPNIFYDSTLTTTNKFSIAKGIEWMDDTPDVIIIDHGANQQGVEWATVKDCYDFIISNVKNYNTAHSTNIKIVICVQQPGGLLDTIYTFSMPSKWGKNFSPTKLINYINEYDDRESEGIYLLPQYLFIDPYKDYPRADVPCSPRNTSLKEITLDNVHMGINMYAYDSTKTYSYGETCTDGQQNGYISLMNNNTAPLSDDKIHWAKTKDDVNAGYWKLADAYFAELKYIV